MLTIIAILLGLILVTLVWLLIDAAVKIYNDVRETRAVLLEIKDIIRTDNGRIMNELRDLPLDLWSTARIIGSAPIEKDTV